MRRALVPLTLLLACNRTPAPAPEPAPPAVEADPAPPPAPPPPAPATAAVREVVALQPGDTIATLAAEGETEVDPSATFRVVLVGPSRDARLALHDAADAAVPAAATAEIGETTLL